MVAKYKLYNAKDQVDYLKQGFYEIIPININSLLDEVDLRV